MKFVFTTICLFAAIICIGNADEFSFKGIVVDAENGAPLPGSTVRIVGSNRGAYASKNGIFKVLLHEEDQKFRVSSIGYEPLVVSISSLRRDGTAEIRLRPSAVKSKGVVVQSILPETVVRRAIEKKNENKSKKKTLTAVVYSKTNVEMDDATAKRITGMGSNGFSASFGSNDGDKNIDESKYVIMETFSNYYCDYERPLYYSEIIQRRQTRNIPAENNILALTNFIDLTADEINLMGTRLVPPIGKDALSHYDFSFGEDATDNGRKVYVIDFKPNSSLFPGFTGRMMIIDSTYDLIMLRMRPSDETAINFVKNLKFEQRFKEADRDVWVPDYLETDASINVNVVKGMLDFGLNFRILTMLNNIRINIPLPDSVYKYTDSDNPRYVSAKADSARPEFWEMNAMSELSAEEKKIYAKVDTAVVKNDSIRKQDSTDTGLGWGSLFKFDPYLDFNRVGSISLGLSKEVHYRFISLTPTYYYSFGQKKSFGEGELKIDILQDWNQKLSIEGKIFSRLSSTGHEEPYYRLMNTVAAGLFHADYYDYMRNDGFSAAISGLWKTINFKADYSEYRSFSLEKKTDKSIFDDSKWRDNPAIDEGAFRSIGAKIELGNSLIYITPSEFDYHFVIAGKYTEPIRYISGNAAERYRSANAQLTVNLPLFYTGYNPISLRLSAGAGAQDSSVAVQDLFQMRSNLVLVANNPAFYSAPYSRYAGTKYWFGQAEINLSDILWRAIGLPLYEGRGPELYLTAASGKFELGKASAYRGTGKDYYSEIGFGFHRIPTFFSNVIYWDFAARWGVGALASGNFGVAINISLPF